MHGQSGKDTVVYLPLGTTISQCGINSFNGEDDTVKYSVVKEFLKKDDEFIAAFGGKGGRGNTLLKTDNNNHPRWSEPGEDGECIFYELELKSIADIGFVGFPNAGKSSLLKCISNAEPAISAYPFTTLNPHIGHSKYWYKDKQHLITFADIPGIIEGASNNEGLGLQFLRHIERTSVLLYVIDIIGCDNRDPVSDFISLRNELKMYDDNLLKKPSIIFANKCDVLDDFNIYKGQFMSNYQSQRELKYEINDRLNRLNEICLKEDGKKMPIIRGSALKRNVGDLFSLSLDFINQYKDDQSKILQQQSYVIIISMCFIHLNRT